MPNKRILSLWFPHLGAERLLRAARGTIEQPFAVVAQVGQAQALSSLSAEAEAEGLRIGQPLRDATAMCPNLLTALQNPQSEAQFLAHLRRWAGKYSPWVADYAPDGLMIDITGCAHLFGGELATLQTISTDFADLGLTTLPGLADTVGAAWALARYAGQPPGTTLGTNLGTNRSGDDIDQEAYATRAKAGKRRNWERGGQAPKLMTLRPDTHRIASSGKTHTAIGPLPVAALRLSDSTVTELNRLGLRRISDLAGQPRAGLARRFGRELVLRLDQALGMVPEPVSPAKPPMHFACRLSFPEPIGLESDILAGLDRLLPQLELRLNEKGRGARRVRLQAYRSDSTMQWIDAGLARPSASPHRIRPLLAMKIQEIDAGFGIDMLRLEATLTEPQHRKQHKGHMDAGTAASDRAQDNTSLDDLIGRLGARVGLESITREHPAQSHLPEKASKTLAAAWSEPCFDWPKPTRPRPLLLWPPEPVHAEQTPLLPGQFRWRNRDLTLLEAKGPERIAPEWWLDDPEWRSGTRDYWRVSVTSGETLWLFYAHGAAMSAGWFCHGQDISSDVQSP
ncbi:MAG: DNA polymerase Y family protein [Pseudomonadota bacterium]